MSKAKPFSKNGDQNGAVPAVPLPASALPLTCAGCGGAHGDETAFDIVVQPQAGRLSARTQAGRTALKQAVQGIDDLDVAPEVVGMFIDWCIENGLRVGVRGAERGGE